MDGMQISHMTLASVAILSIAGCNAEQAAEAKNAPGASATEVPAPKDGDWSKLVSKTPEGGFVMGNPNAKVKLVEFGSLTCGHCAAFEEQGGKALVDHYVKKGLVSWEFRNMIHDPFDMTAALLARCGGAPNFFGLAQAFYTGQKEWIGKIQTADPAKMQALQTMSPAQQFSTIADISGLNEYAARGGVPRTKGEQCLADDAEVDRLVQMNTDATISYGNLGTPSFLINGALVEKAHSWDVLEPKIKEALAS
jgi:protein-disulfide isomerase